MGTYTLLQAKNFDKFVFIQIKSYLAFIEVLSLQIAVKPFTTLEFTLP